MWYHIVTMWVVVSALFLQACVPGPAKPGGVSATTVSVGSIGELRAYLGGKETVHSPQSGGAVPVVRLLADTLPRLNLQAACFLREEDVARIKATGDSLELVFASPTDVLISQRIEEKQRGQIPADGQGFRILTLGRAVFVLRGEMSGHVLVGGDKEGNWGCWAIESKGSIDSRWIEAVEKAVEGSGLR